MVGWNAEAARARCRDVRISVLEMAKRANKGHIGSSLSIVELLETVLEDARGVGTQDWDRDRIVLSKGHAATALYAHLFHRGHLSPEQIASYSSNGSLLMTHPSHKLAAIDFSTGSLGQGITFAVGAALAARLRNDASRTYCILSDSELDEGSTWESALIASQLKLNNLVVIVDFNGQQALGKTDDVISLGGVPEAWASLGWNVSRVNGHDVESLNSVMRETHLSDQPSLLVCETFAGKGVNFMERKVEWHYWPMNSEQYTGAVAQVLQGLPNEE